MTLLEDLITLLGVALLEVFIKIQMNGHLVRGFTKRLLNQLCKEILESLLQWLKINNEMT